jgi:hypothetical protein
LAIREKDFCRVREATLAKVGGRSLPAKLRESTARLFSPYL